MGLLYTRHRISQRSTDTSDRIHYSLLQFYCILLNVRCLRDSLSVTDSGSHSGTPFEAPFVDFCVTKFIQNFLRRYLKENRLLKILAACHSGAPLQPGALRTCVPCLMVNPALAIIFDYYKNVTWAASLMSCWLHGSPLTCLFIIFALLYFIQCMVTNKYDSIKSNYWNRPEQSGFRLC